jgi:uncharacterized protein YdbL (DUF1318 family)
MNIREKIREINKTVYQKMAEKHGVSIDYVSKIANGKRNATKKKGLAVKQDLENLLNE